MAPLIVSVLRFFFQKYGPAPTGAFHNNASWAGQVWIDSPAYGPTGDMRIVLSPAQALETWQECINPTDTIAGLIRVTRSFLSLPNSVLKIVPKRDIFMVKALSEMLPAFPVAKDSDGKYFLKHGEYCSRNANVENTALYAMHPFHLLSVNQTQETANLTGGVTPLNVEQGISTYKQRLYLTTRVKTPMSWSRAG